VLLAYKAEGCAGDWNDCCTRVAAVPSLMHLTVMGTSNQSFIDLMLEAASSSEMNILFHQTAQCHIQKRIIFTVFLRA